MSHLLDHNRCALCVIDIQERLLPHMHGADQVVQQASTLMQAAREMEVPVLVTEQYPKGLGLTVEPIRQHATEAIRHEKTTFSCFGCEEFVQDFQSSGRSLLILCGIESHVCVLQTALEGLARDIRIAVVADAVSSRDPNNHQLAIERIRQAGVEIVSTEMVCMEWLRSSTHPRFKALQRLIK